MPTGRMVQRKSFLALGVMVNCIKMCAYMCRGDACVASGKGIPCPYGSMPAFGADFYSNSHGGERHNEA